MSLFFFLRSYYVTDFGKKKVFLVKKFYFFLSFFRPFRQTYKLDVNVTGTREVANWKRVGDPHRIFESWEKYSKKDFVRPYWSINRTWVAVLYNSENLENKKYARNQRWWWWWWKNKRKRKKKEPTIYPSNYSTIKNLQIFAKEIIPWIFRVRKEGSVIKRVKVWIVVVLCVAEEVIIEFAKGKLKGNVCLNGVAKLFVTITRRKVG